MTQSPGDDTKVDRLHALQLLRDLDIVNARTKQELGPLPSGGVPVIPKRKPDLTRPAVKPSVASVWSEPSAATEATLASASLPSTAAPPETATLDIPAPPVSKPARATPPLPERLRETLADFPEHIQALQYSLNKVASGSSSETSLFDQAVAALDIELESFLEEARMELMAAEKTGNAESISRAEEKELLMSRAKFKHRWLSDNAFREYFGADQAQDG